jgi:hypothetical protein
MENKEWSLNHFFGLSATNVVLITFLISWVEIVPTIGRNLQTETSFSVGSALTSLLGETDERWGTK